MRILFLCGSLEPGRDGVGDYTRRLAVELAQIGYEVEIIAFMDKFISSFTMGFEEKGSVRVRTGRFPFNDGYKLNCRNAKKLIDSFKPDWISLQYVPFSFNNKGIHYNLGNHLAKIGRGSKWHIMFHELWVGRGTGTTIKKKILSITQQWLVEQLLNILKPSIIHTHLPYYQYKLKKLGFSALPLTLFSNIKFFTRTVQINEDQIFRFAFFSQVGVSEQIFSFINRLVEEASVRGFSCELVFIGGIPKEVEPLLKIYGDKCPLLNKIRYTGFLDEISVSEIISRVDLGVTPVPRHALGKSGSVAAFLLHGVPVAAPVFSDAISETDIGFFKKTSIDSILLHPEWEKLMHAKKAVTLVKSEIDISILAKGFYSDLINKSKNN